MTNKNKTYLRSVKLNRYLKVKNWVGDKKKGTIRKYTVFDESEFELIHVNREQIVVPEDRSTDSSKEADASREVGLTCEHIKYLQSIEKDKITFLTN